MKFLLLICSLVLSFNFPTVEYICFILTSVLCVRMMMTMTVTDDYDDDNNNSSSHNMMVLR
jgi:hypothetical protein